MPSGRFGANAAWWLAALLAHNLHTLTAWWSLNEDLARATWKRIRRCPAGSRRPPDRKRQATHPQDVPERHRRTAGCAPEPRRSIYRARLTPGWQRSRKSRRNQRATPGCCPALRRDGPKPRAATLSGPRHRADRSRIPNRESKSPRPEASARWSQGRQAQKSLEMLKIVPATARQPDLIADPGLERVC